MATIEIISWKNDYISPSAWADNPRSELNKRLRRAIKASPSEIKRLNRQILARESVILHQVDDKSVPSVMQILEALGAEIRITLTAVNMTVVFKGHPPGR